MVETDRAVAFVMDDLLLDEPGGRLEGAGRLRLSKDAFSKPKPDGIMLRNDDQAFKKVVDAATVRPLHRRRGPEDLKSGSRRRFRPRAQPERDDRLN